MWLPQRAERPLTGRRVRISCPGIHPCSAEVAVSKNAEMLRIASGIVLLMAGTIWILQGLDVAFAPESFMTGDLAWTGAGVVAVIAGVGFIWWGARGHRRER